MLSLFITVALATAPSPKPAANTICPTCSGKADAKSPKVVVRGREYRVCCPECGEQLKGNPDKYLKPDGSPRNGK
jgi:YHS domain-containing protein